ncbi:MAG: hypothetical protein ACUVQ5_03050 [Candidatus Methanomethylicaceae archaeon]
MPYLKTLRAKILLLALSLFYDVAFIERVWTDPDLFRAYVGLLGLLVAGTSGILYSLESLLMIQAPSLPYSTAIIIGLMLFLIGGLGRRISLAFDITSSREYIRSRETILCFTSDTKHSSSIIELLIFSISHRDEKRLKEVESLLLFAHEIWRESLMKKGMHIVGQWPIPQELRRKSL